MIVPYCRHPSQIKILSPKALKMHLEGFKIFPGGHTPGLPLLRDEHFPDPTPLTASRLDWKSQGKVREFHFSWRVVSL